MWWICSHLGPEVGSYSMDDVFETVARRRRRARKAKQARRDVNYAELLKPSVIPEERCPHTLQVVAKSECSQCSGVRVKRVQSRFVPVPEE